MSANFIIEYGGHPVRVLAGGESFELVHEHQADPFLTESDAWLAVGRINMPQRRFRVVNLYERNTAAPRQSGSSALPVK